MDKLVNNNIHKQTKELRCMRRHNLRQISLGHTLSHNLRHHRLVMVRVVHNRVSMPIRTSRWISTTIHHARMESVR
eukprot:12884071-Prorocentrum_lima.AAC.1